jgi:quercetin dioxygenase-like cupin family protein
VRRHAPPIDGIKPEESSVTAPERILAKSASFFSTRDAIAPERIATVEGVKEMGHVEVRKLLVGDEILLLHVFRKKGLVDPVHKHLDHESMGYLISGKLRLIIGGKEFIATPGTSWMHPVDVEHFSEALEDCEQLEIKSPPRKTWVSQD